MGLSKRYLFQMLTHVYGLYVCVIVVYSVPVFGGPMQNSDFVFHLSASQQAQIQNAQWVSQHWCLRFGMFPTEQQAKQ